MRNLFAFVAGGFFGAGLYTSGMTDTTKVQGWLDVFGEWDPTLAFVMAGAILPMALAWAVVRRRSAPVLGGTFPPKPASVIDRNLMLGSTMFGAGWGLVGLCPGPSLASISYAGLGGVIFLLSMVAGMFVAPPVKARLASLAA